MSEGGFLPWKVQKISSRGPACSYENLSNPLPDPPLGLVWYRDESTREWSLLPESPPLPVDAVDEIRPAADAQLVPEHCDYLEHAVSPTDTLQGICLRYRISVVSLRQANGFSGSNLRLAPDRLVIPLEHSKARKPKDSAKETANRKIGRFLSSFEAKDIPSRKEAEAYLMTSDWDVDNAVADARADLQWEANN